MGQLQHHASVLGAILSTADGPHGRTFQRQVIEYRRRLGVGEIENDAIRRDQGEGLVMHRPGKIEDQAELVGVLPGPGTLELLTGGKCRQPDRQGHASQDQIEQTTAIHGVLARNEKRLGSYNITLKIACHLTPVNCRLDKIFLRKPWHSVRLQNQL